MVFQHFNLFPHLTVKENCTLALVWVRKMPQREAIDAGPRAPVNRPSSAASIASRSINEATSSWMASS